MAFAKIRSLFYSLGKASISANNNKRKAIKNLLGFRPRSMHLYNQAFLHNSALFKAQQEKRRTLSNERLEFLGDAVLDCAVADVLFKFFPQKGEGFLTEMRSKIVSREKLSELSIKMGLNFLLDYDTGSVKQNHVVRGISGNALEALIGAVYIDRGYSFAYRFVKRIIKQHIDIASLAQEEFNFKSRLIEWSHRNKQEIKFKILDEQYQSGMRQYTVAIEKDGVEICRAIDSSKKKAEQHAARFAIEKVLMVK